MEESPQHSLCLCSGNSVVSCQGVCRRKKTRVFTRYSGWLLPMKAAPGVPVPTYPLSHGSTRPHLVVAVGCGFHSNLLWVLESVKFILTGFAMLSTSGMNLAQNTGLRFPNFRLKGLVYMLEAVYCCSLQPSPFFSRVLQSFRIQVFPSVLPYKGSDVPPLHLPGAKRKQECSSRSVLET